MFVRFSKRLMNDAQDKFSRKIGASGKRYRPRYICTIYVNCIFHFAVVVSSSLDLCETRFLYTPTRSGSLSGRNL